jgi:hypothetical protein
VDLGIKSQEIGINITRIVLWIKLIKEKEKLR